VLRSVITTAGFHRVFSGRALCKAGSICGVGIRNTGRRNITLFPECGSDVLLYEPPFVSKHELYTTSPS
jgi:hypothetical protein